MSVHYDDQDPLYDLHTGILGEQNYEKESYTKDTQKEQRIRGG